MAKRDTSTYALTARRQIAEELRTLAIFSVPRSSALLNYFVVLEVQYGKLSLDSTIAIFGGHRKAVESGMYALPAIFEWCPDESTSSGPTTEEIYKQADDLFEFTRKYAQVEYCYTLAERGNFEISVAQKDPRITFSYASSEADRADTPGRAREILPRISEESSSLDEHVFSEISQRLRNALSAQNLLIKPETCAHVISDDVLSVMRDLAEAFSQRLPVRMDSEINVGEVTFGDFRRFWSALLSMIETHWMAHALTCGGDLEQVPRKTIVIKKQRTEMATLVSCIARLSYRAAEFILGCYLYDPQVNGKRPICQPIVPITKDHVCFSSLMLSHFDFERNFFKLLHISPSLLEFASFIDAQKEPIALRHLSTLFPESEFAIRSCVVIPGKTDADLLVYERLRGFTLVIQHKWLTAPETPEESSSNDEYLQKGIKQGIVARDFLRLDHTFVRETLKLAASAPIERVECVTVCRGLEESGFMEQSDVPVVEEQALEALLKQTEGLGGLWTALVARPDKAFAAELAVDTTMTIQLGAYEFVMPALGF